MGENADAVRRGIELFNQGKIPELVELYDPEVEIEAAGTLAGGAFKGKEGLVEWFQKIGALYPSGIHIKVENLLESGNMVVAEWRGKGTLKNGTEIETKSVNVFEFRGGKALKHRFYTDSEQLARLMGQL